MDGIGLKKNYSVNLLRERMFLLLEAMVFAVKKYRRKNLDHHGLVLMAWTSFCLAKFQQFSDQKNTWLGDRSLVFFHLK